MQWIADCETPVVYISFGTVVDLHATQVIYMHTRTPRICLTLHVKKVHTAVCGQAPSAFLCGKKGVVLGVRERSEMFPQ